MKIHAYTYRYLLISIFLCGIFALSSLLYVANAPLGKTTLTLATGNAMVYEAMKGLLLALIGAGVLEYLIRRTESRRE